MSASPRLAAFLAFSADVTAFTQYELVGTGQADDYLETVDRAVDVDRLDALLAAYTRVPAVVNDDATAHDAFLRREIFGDARLGPVARNIIKLWYVGIWYELPRAWTEAYGARARNVTFTVSAQAYTEGLLWPAIGANPPGAKAPGFASWTEPPQIPSF